MKHLKAYPIYYKTFIDEALGSFITGIAYIEADTLEQAKELFLAARPTATIIKPNEKKRTKRGTKNL